MAIDRLGDDFREWKRRRLAAAVALVRHAAGQAEAEMKAHAEWTDRTALARGGLRGEAQVYLSSGEQRVDLVLSHSVDYGAWLETVNGAAMGRRAAMPPAELAERQYAGNFAIVWPTLDRVFPRLRRDYRRLWGEA